MSEWKEQKERSNSFTLKLICWIALHLSRKFARLLLWPITIYFFITSSSIRFSSNKYLQRIPSKNGNIWQVINHIHHFAAVILDRLYFLTGRMDMFNLQVNNRECLNEVIVSDKGAILLGAHIGSFDASRCVAEEDSRASLKILMHRNHNAMITKIMDELNPSLADLVIDLTDSFVLLKIKEELTKGCLIGILGDRVLKTEKEVKCNILGGAINIPEAPFSLAIILGVPIIVFFAIYDHSNKYILYHFKIYDGKKIKRSERKQAINDVAQLYVEKVEFIVKEHPYNWFNFYNYWSDEC